MRLIDLRNPAFFLALLAFSSAATAGAGAYSWLMKMNQATRTLNYDGTFVYQHGDQLEAMRIIHAVRDGSVRERLVSLNGSAREVIRDDQQVMCYLPDRKSIIVEHRFLGRDKSFPVVLPESVRVLSKNYVIQLGAAGRVSGRDAQVVIIRPRDQYRYGYHLWADKETGLLLKADLVDHMGKTLEQFMFTQVKIGHVIDVADLQPAMGVDDMAWYVGKTMDDATVQPAKGWTVSKVPVGFVLSNHMMRKTPAHGNPVEHLVYTDGLAAISIFIEKVDKGTRSVIVGGSTMGAVHAFGSVVNDHQIIVVGEVPAATVELIARSVVAQPQ